MLIGRDAATADGAIGAAGTAAAGGGEATVAGAGGANPGLNPAFVAAPGQAQGPVPEQPHEDMAERLLRTLPLFRRRAPAVFGGRATHLYKEARNRLPR